MYGDRSQSKHTYVNEVWMKHYECYEGTVSKVASCLKGKVVNKDNVAHDMRIIPASFCVMRYINDGRYLTVEKAPYVGNLRHVQNINAEFFQTQSPGVAAGFQHPPILGTQAFCDINVGEEFYCDYGSYYDFQSNENLKSPLCLMVVIATNTIV